MFSWAMLLFPWPKRIYSQAYSGRQSATRAEATWGWLLNNGFGCGLIYSDIVGRGCNVVADPASDGSGCLSRRPAC
jgi:hypothetical protein